MNYCSSFSGFNLYHTNHLRNGLYRDCLYYQVLERRSTYQLIEYCICSELEEDVSDDIGEHRRFTFEDLRKQNITSEMLIEWSAPVDLIENYQIYLDNHSAPSSFIFYNCTFPWFGSHCEYSFDKPEFSFAKQVLKRFGTDVYRLQIPDILPCYTHLQCDRTGDHGQTPGACLDWREICDGEVHCLDGGRDEEQCWQLEINECDNETEYRCHNGQCIPRDFLNDDLLYPDCLDQSDEYVILRSWIFDSREIADCYAEHDFRCEERLFRRTTDKYATIPCGDGSSSGTFSYNCRNHRIEILTSAFLRG
ncbi:unnamed protein product, partial [Rotaria sp. Silwood1]